MDTGEKKMIKGSEVIKERGNHGERNAECSELSSGHDEGHPEMTSDKDKAFGEEFMKESITGPLLDWYRIHKRVLPWRSDPTPYHVWLSEIMLQQTRVEAVKDYYARFLRELPDILHLAECPEDRYLKLWEGLGYYSRVRNLHKAAKVITEEFHGELPADYALLRGLPGIGAYTAAAIASIAFQLPYPAVDGNLLRIFSRLTEYGENSKTEAAKKAAEAFFLPLMPERPGDFNQALMDLGSGVCLPNGQPLCGECPLNSVCRAFHSGSVQRYPVIPRKAERPVERKTVLLIHNAGKLVLGKRPSKGLLAGLYEFPNQEGWLSEEEALDFVRSLGFSPLRILPLPGSRHIFTHRIWEMTAYDILADELAPLPEKGPYFLAAFTEIDRQYSIPSAFREYKKRLPI